MNNPNDLDSYYTTIETSPDLASKPVLVLARSEPPTGADDAFRIHLGPAVEFASGLLLQLAQGSLADKELLRQEPRVAALATELSKLCPN